MKPLLNPLLDFAVGLTVQYSPLSTLVKRGVQVFLGVGIGIVLGLLGLSLMGLSNPGGGFGEISWGREITGGAMTTSKPSYPLLVTDWTPSFQLYGQPHAIWLSEDAEVGVNLPKLKQTLAMAKKRLQQPEIVIYSIPDRDMGQSSAGGFTTEADYLAENQGIADKIQRFVKKTNIPPRVYLEPDALGHAITYLKESPPEKMGKARQIYRQRVRLMNTLIDLYHEAGAWVYLDAAHGGWFDYGDQDIAGMVDILIQSGMARADGFTTNVSNRQPVSNLSEENEVHYVRRLRQQLEAKLGSMPWDVVVDTSRNGGRTTRRFYYLAADGTLRDNEWSDAHNPRARVVGKWHSPEGLEADSCIHKTAEILPKNGKPTTIERLIALDRYGWDAEKRLLLAPPWLDPIGDVQPGPSPTDTPVIAVSNQVMSNHGISRFRYIKPPDDCDGSLHCPPGASKQAINQSLQP